MIETFNIFSAIATAIFLEAMPFLAIGALFSATIEVFVSTERLLSCIPKSVAGGLALGIGAGFVLPTCECGVVPIVRRLMRKGVPPYIAIAYMLAAPIVNPVVLASTYLAFRGSLTMVGARIAVAAVVATLLGLYARWPSFPHPFLWLDEAWRAWSVSNTAGIPSFLEYMRTNSEVLLFSEWVLGKLSLILFGGGALGAPGVWRLGSRAATLVVEAGARRDFACTTVGLP